MYKNAIEQAYSMLGDATPLKKDCGRLCRGRCCKGDDETGMLLFPGEAEICRENGEIKKGADGHDYLICGGVCNRETRPLSCRIFPLFPLVTVNDGTVSVEAVTDIRAERICPLASGSSPDRRFRTAVRRCGKVLASDENCLALLGEISELITGIAELKKILKN